MPSRALPDLLLSLLLSIPIIASAEDQSVHFLDFRSKVPAGWISEQATSGMRVVQMKVPGGEGAEPAEFIVYYFGPGQGGSAEANVERWKSQFSSPEGSPVEPTITSLEGSRVPATLVELEGSYARSVGLGPSGDALPNRMLLAAVVETPQGNLYPQLHGPAELVKSQRAGFVAFVEGIAPDPAP